jgi:hypothetical protein
VGIGSITSRRPGEKHYSSLSTPSAATPPLNVVNIRVSDSV